MYNFYTNDKGQGFCQMERNVARGNGKYVSVPSVVVTMCEIDGVALRKEGTNVVKYALTMDGEPINKWADRKTAVEMFLDFAGVSDRKRKALAKALMAV